MTHQYIGIEIVTMTAAMRSTLVEHIRGLGPLEHAQPSHLHHGRVRLDNQAYIGEAEFEAETITAEAICDRLAGWYGVAADSVTYSTTQTPYGPVMTIKTGSTSRLRLIAFGGLDADGAGSAGESHEAVLAYLAANRDAWEPGEEVTRAVSRGPRGRSGLRRRAG